MNLDNGEILTLDNNKEYIVFLQKEHNNKHYIGLMSNFKPLEIKFAEALFENNELSVRIVNNQEEKLEVLKLFDLDNE